MQLGAITMLVASASVNTVAAPSLLSPNDISIGPGEVIALGEQHGTTEGPVVASKLIDSLALRSTVVLGLELDTDSAAISCGDAPLVIPHSWRSEFADGRSSRAMRDLLCHALTLEKAGKITIVYLDGDKRGAGFDSKAANFFVQEMRSKPRSVGVVFAGNFHTRNAAGGVSAAIRSLGYKVTTATISSPDKAGTAWQCQDDGCGNHAIGIDFCPIETALKAPIWRFSQNPMWDRCLVIPKVSLSPPLDSQHPAIRQ